MAGMGFMLVSIICFVAAAEISRKSSTTADATALQDAKGASEITDYEGAASSAKRHGDTHIILSYGVKAGMLERPGIAASLWAWVTSFFPSRRRKREGSENESAQADLQGDGAGEGAANISEAVKPYVEQRLSSGQDVVYSRDISENPSGIAFLFHGCGQWALDWFQLPENRRIVEQLRTEGIAAIAFSSTQDAATRCWSTRFPAEKNGDAMQVMRAANEFLSNKSIPDSLPRYGIGVSSGATMLSVLSGASSMPRIASQALYISPGSMRAFNAASPTYPNTIFVHSKSDDSFASAKAVSLARQALIDKQVGIVGEMSQRPVALQPLTFHARDPVVSIASSHRLFKIMDACRAARDEAEEEAADDEGDVSNRCRYEEAVAQNADDPLLQALTGSPLATRALRQVIRVISGSHELSSSSCDKVISWLQNHARPAPRSRPRPL